MIRFISLRLIALTGLLAAGLLLWLACAAPASTGSASAGAQPVPAVVSQAGLPSAASTTGDNKTAQLSQNAVNIVVAGYINHGPLQPTVRAIKDVLSKYSDKVNVTWVDLSTQQGQDYFKQHGLSAHMNIMVNGTTHYPVNGKEVDFQWFEGQGWTKQDLETVIAGLVNK